MGMVHDIIEAGGKEAALRADIKRAVVEAASLYMADESVGMGFLYSGWCQAALPHRRLPDEAPWQIVSDHITLAVEPGRRPDAGGKLISVGVPYGSRARLIMLYLQSEALRTGSRDVLLGRSLRDWLGRMGISTGGKSQKDVREQAERIARCRFTFHVNTGNRVGLVNQNVVDSAMFVPSEPSATTRSRSISMRGWPIASMPCQSPRPSLGRPSRGSSVLAAPAWTISSPPSSPT
jgi:Plasmid encoded RepA protein